MSTEELPTAESEAESLDTSEELKSLLARHQLILDSAGEGIYGLDAEGKTTFANQAATRILGWRAEDVIGETLGVFSLLMYDVVGLFA